MKRATRNIFIGAVIIVIVIAIILFAFKMINKPSGEINTFEKLKAEGSPQYTEYNKCMNAIKDCIANKLKVEGYTDGVDCMQNPENTICNSDTDTGFKRYNAEVDASNNCTDELKFDEMDCLKLKLAEYSD